LVSVGVLRRCDQHRTGCHNEAEARTPNPRGGQARLKEHGDQCPWNAHDRKDREGPDPPVVLRTVEIEPCGEDCGGEQRKQAAQSCREPPSNTRPFGLAHRGSRYSHVVDPPRSLPAEKEGSQKPAPKPCNLTNLTPYQLCVWNARATQPSRSADRDAGAVCGGAVASCVLRNHDATIFRTVEQPILEGLGVTVREIGV
jgi:hypothetical protein